MRQMNELDEVVTNDAEILGWFTAANWVDLSLALSRAFRTEVSFPHREEGPPVEPTSPLWVSVFGTGPELEYPMTVAAFVEDVAYAVYEAQEVVTWSVFEQRVRHVEGVGVRVWREPFAPRRSWDDLVLDEYPYSRAMPGSSTVAYLRRTRFAKGRPHFTFEVLRPDGTVASGQTRLATVRRMWAEQSPPEPPEARDRVAAWAAEARFVAWMLSLADG